MSADARDEALALARAAVAAAVEAGAADADATVTIGDKFTAEARDTTITVLERSRGRALGLRAFVGKRRATLATSDLSAESVRALARRVVEAAAFVGEDPHAGLPDATPEPPEDGALAIFADDVPARPAESKRDDALALERAIRAADRRIENSNGSRCSDTLTVVGLANSRGFGGVYRATTASRSTSPVARSGDEKRTDGYATAGRSWAACETVDAVARRAAQRTVALFGARKPPTGRLPIIFERDVAAAVLADVFNALSAANVAVGNSWLAGALGERVGSDAVTIVDDGRLAGGIGSAPFDAEGTATRRTVAIERGVLRTWLADAYNGRRIGIATTGNAGGAGVAPTNFFLAPGDGSLEDLIARTPRGILVVSTIGFATEYASGTYSRGAAGIMIRDGALAEPLDEFTIAASMREMLGAIDAVAGDLVLDAAVASPSFRVAEMTVSGS